MTHYWGFTDDLALGGGRPWEDNAWDAYFYNGLVTSNPQNSFLVFITNLIIGWP